MSTATENAGLWAPVDAALARLDHARRAAHAQRDEDARLGRLLKEWDALTVEQKWAEWDATSDSEGQNPSRFAEIPGFTPRYCEACHSHVFPDCRTRPEGACPFGNHRIEFGTIAA